MIPITSRRGDSRILLEWVKETLQPEAPALVFGMILAAISVISHRPVSLPAKESWLVVISFDLHSNTEFSFEFEDPIVHFTERRP